MNEPQTFSYESMGTGWAVSIWDDIPSRELNILKEDIIRMSSDFDHTYSRFIQNSLIWKLAKLQGVQEVPTDLVRMLRLYESLHTLSGGKLNPLVGFALSDLGYDETYSLQKKEAIRSVPDFPSTLRILDDNHIELHDFVLIDLGALGKGYFVDTIASYLEQKGIQRFLVNGSGDIYYKGNGIPLRAGLEDPNDTSKVLGVLEITDGALCASAGNRRAWGEHHHTLDPDSLTSPREIAASWVKSSSAALADGLCTCLMLTEPERYVSLSFEYCLLNPAYQIKRSAGFTAELF